MAAAAAACSLTTSFDGLSNGPFGTDGGDAASAPDAPVTAADGGDASTDGGDGGDGGALAFRCADHTGALFCSDFETEPFNTGWPETFTNNGGQLATGIGRHGKDLESLIPTRGPPSVSTRPSAAVRSAITLASRQPITLAFDLQIESGAGGGILDIGGINFDNPFYIVTFRMDDGGNVGLHEYGAAFGPNAQVNEVYPLAMQPPLGTWFHVAMHMTFPAGSDVHMLVTFDGTTVYDGKLSAGPWASQPKIYGGVGNAESAGQARMVRFDDVLVTTP